MASVDVTVAYKEKLPYREVARIYGHFDATKVGGGTVSIDAKDFGLKTLRVITLTPAAINKGPGIGSITDRGSIGNSVTYIGSVAQVNFVAIGE